MSDNLTVSDLYSLEEYSEKRAAFRERVMKHKQDRRIALGPNLTIYFESKMTIQYQVQEMLRIEKIFEKRAIEEELSAYTALVPDSRNFKATMMLEYTDESVRRRKLRELKGIERGIWFQVGDGDKIFAIADEDLEREDREKTSAVHFLRFPISEQMIEKMRIGASIMMGVEHPSCQIEPITLSERTYQSLLMDMI
tara:strand:- start:60 stop:647 length:588 start_codon:yes stop_codon:yes gene_type:complete